MAQYDIIKKGLRRAGRLYIDLLKAELDFQRHNASGRLRQGFFIDVYEGGGSLIMDVMNDTEYMWTVNNGSSSGVTVTYDAIKAWAISKGFSFDSAKHEKKSISHIVSELRTKYLTPMGDKVAPRRYYFIEVAVDTATKMGLTEAVEEDIRKQIDAEIGAAGSSKAIQLKIG